MSHIVEHIQRLQQRQTAPIQGIIGATGLGREAAQLRAATEAPGRILGPGDTEKSLADAAIAELDLTIWEASLTSTQRSAAAWALGQIGGLQPARKLLARLEAIFVRPGPRTLGPAAPAVQREAPEVCATLIEALAHAIDRSTGRRLSRERIDSQRLRQIYAALHSHMLVSKHDDPDLSTALAMALAKLALNCQAALPKDALGSLLDAPEPIATLATIGALNELIQVEQRESALDHLYGGEPRGIVDAVFGELGSRRGRPYSDAEIGHLLQIAEQFWHAEADTRIAADHQWEKIE